jgi:hypothetical protein
VGGKFTEMRGDKHDQGEQFLQALFLESNGKRSINGFSSSVQLSSAEPSLNLRQVKKM